MQKIESGVASDNLLTFDIALGIKFRHKPAIRSEKDSSVGRGWPALLMSTSNPSQSQVVWMYTGMRTTIQAEYYVMDLHTAAEKHAGDAKTPPPATHVKRLERLMYALYHLNNRLREYAFEQEVILYTPEAHQGHRRRS